MVVDGLEEVAGEACNGIGHFAGVWDGESVAHHASDGLVGSAEEDGCVHPGGLLGGDDAAGGGSVDDEIVACSEGGEEAGNDEVVDALWTGSIVGGEETFEGGRAAVKDGAPIVLEVDEFEVKRVGAVAGCGVVAFEEGSMVLVGVWEGDGIGGGEPELAFGQVVGHELCDAVEHVAVERDADFRGGKGVFEAEFDEEQVGSLVEEAGEGVFEGQFLAGGVGGREDGAEREVFFRVTRGEFLVEAVAYFRCGESRAGEQGDASEFTRFDFSNDA